MKRITLLFLLLTPSIFNIIVGITYYNNLDIEESYILFGIGLIGFVLYAVLLKTLEWKG